MSSTQTMIDQANRVLLQNYARQPVLFTKGRGCHLFDAEGNSYLDFVGGIAVTSLGHCHPSVTIAIQKQAQRLVHVSNLYYNQPQIDLAEALVEVSFADRAFFCNSGAEANEAAIKLARKAMGPARYEIITALGSFHGRTMLTVAATGQEKVKTGFSPLPPGFVHVPYNDVSAIANAITPQTAAVMVEPALGEGGVHPAEPGYLSDLRALCDREGILLILDEIQTGIGRCGTLFAYEQEGMIPDVITLAKGLGNGFPIGAMLTRERLAQALGPGTHGTTFGGGPLACAAALAVLSTVRSEPWLLENVVRMGERLSKGLARLGRDFPRLREVRGRGLLVGCEVEGEARPIVAACLEERLLVSLAGASVVRFTPALIAGEEEIDEAITRFSRALERSARKEARG